LKTSTESGKGSYWLPPIAVLLSSPQNPRAPGESFCFFLNSVILFKIILLVHWVFIVTFTKVLRVYHSLFPSFITILYPPSPHSWNSFSRSHFSIFLCKYIIFSPYSLSYTLSLYPPSPTVINSQTGSVSPSCSLFLKQEIFVCKSYTEIFIMTFLYICAL
jgi:hypothetical protein